MRNTHPMFIFFEQVHGGQKQPMKAMVYEFKLFSLTINVSFVEEK